MATMRSLRERSEGLFADLLARQARPRRGSARRPGVSARRGAERFSWFDPRDAVRAAALSFRLSALAASRRRPNDALGAALDHVEGESGRSDPEQVRQGFALFVTHNRDGRRLLKPRTVAAAPGLFNPPRGRGGRGRPSISIGGLSPGLDYWREDVLANEHHQHWHEVYPYTGLPPRDFNAWLAQTSRTDLVEILEAIEPGPDWPTIVASRTTAQLATLFAAAVRDENVFDLEPHLYRLMFRLNDRQGELFFYMHQQMLARYDAELLSNGLVRVEPLGPSAWTRPIEAGHDPVGLANIGTRPAGLTLPSQSVDVLRAVRNPLATAVQTGRLRLAGGGTAQIDRTTLGEAVEATVAQLSHLDANEYPGLHNIGHGEIARLSTPRPGVMAYTLTAIRDQSFWQWHKLIDDFNASWQATLPPYDFADSPHVLIRNGLDAQASTPWGSPDIILCRSSDLPANTDPALVGEQLFGGAMWDADFAATSAQQDGTSLTTIDTLTTTMASVAFGGTTIRYLTHEPFSYFLRIENKDANALDVTVRIFLAPADRAQDRRLWMELDKFLLTLPADSKIVAYRPDTESSVIKRPAETSPAAVLAGGGDPDETSYCDCGWPYTLLLPRGTSDGMRFRLLVLCTDAELDGVRAPDHCGSMSYCGAVDRYPDSRDMGYPFSRPFAGGAATGIRDTIVSVPTAAARTVTIQHV